MLDKELERQAEKLRELGKAADEAAVAHGKGSEEALAAQNAYNRQAAAVAKLQDQLNGAKADLAGMENAVRDNKDAIDGLGREVEDAGEAMNSTGQSAVSFGDILKANIIRFWSSLLTRFESRCQLASISLCRATSGSVKNRCRSALMHSCSTCATSCQRHTLPSGGLNIQRLSYSYQKV